MFDREPVSCKIIEPILVHSMRACSWEMSLYLSSSIRLNSVRTSMQLLASGNRILAEDVLGLRVLQDGIERFLGNHFIFDACLLM